METLESSRVCRLCGQQSGISINIFDKNENHVRKINAVLPIMVHEMDLLPKHMCHRCSYKLEEFHKFYMNCLKTDAELKGKLSWMQKDRSREKVGVPMVHIKNVNIKTEPLDYDVYELEPIVENIDYINSMANSVTFPANCIHDGITYAAFPRCRFCCDKKDQSRRRATAAERLCRNYEESVSKSRRGEIADDSLRRTTFESCARLESSRRRTFTHAMFQDHTQEHLPLHADVADEEIARTRLISTETKDASSLEIRDGPLDKYKATSERHQTTSKSTLVRNLRPRRNLINYALGKKKMSSAIPGPSAGIRVTDLTEPRTTSASLGFMLTRQIKVEQTDELEGRILRPRKNVVNYHGPKKRRIPEGKEAELAHHAKKYKANDVGQNSTLQPKNEDISNDLKIKIKQEIPDEISDATSTLSKSHAMVETLVNDVGVGLCRNIEKNYLKTNRTRSESKFQPAKRKSRFVDVAGAAKSTLQKSKKMDGVSVVNYSSKCLRSQDVFLRNGKARRKFDYMEWSMKKLTKKLTDGAMKNRKKVPAMLKLAESIKHYCETCNVSFMNVELFRLHACYFD